MNKIIFLVLFPVLVFAQKKEVIYKKLANFSCECANKIEKPTEMQLGVCLFSSMDKLSEKEKKAIGFNADNKADIETGIYENIGVEMALICPDIFVDKSAPIADEEYEAVADSAAVEAPATYVTGVFESMESKEFNTITITNEENVKQSFIWLFPFDGDSLFIKNKIVKGDKISISFTEQQFFDPKSKSYTTYNEITSISLE
jgi:hypothetical protein